MGALGRGTGSSVTSINPFSAGFLHHAQCGSPVGATGILCMLSQVSFASPLLALVIRVRLRCVLFGELMGDEDTFPE